MQLQTRHEQKKKKEIQAQMNVSEPILVAMNSRNGKIASIGKSAEREPVLLAKISTCRAKIVMHGVMRGSTVSLIALSRTFEKQNTKMLQFVGGSCILGRATNQIR